MVTEERPDTTPTREQFVAAWAATFPGEEAVAARTYDALTRGDRPSPALSAWWADYRSAPVIPRVAGEPLRAGDECTVRLDPRGHMIVYRRGDGDAGNWGLADRDYATGETVRLWEGEGRWS